MWLILLLIYTHGVCLFIGGSVLQKDLGSVNWRAAFFYAIIWPINLAGFLLDVARVWAYADQPEVLSPGKGTRDGERRDPR